MSRETKIVWSVVTIVVIMFLMYLAYRQWWIDTNCFGQIGGTEICK